MKTRQKSPDFPVVNSPVAVELLHRAYNAWSAAADFRQRRERYKRYTYGRQWDDLVTLPDGGVVSELELAMRCGKQPLTNNLIRRLVKSVVGRFRSDLPAADLSPDLSEIHRENALDELDCRLLEEFLISGTAVQHISVDNASGRVVIDNVNPTRFFVNATLDPRGGDIELIGSFSDLSLTEVLRRFADGDRRRALRLCDIYSNTDNLAMNREFGNSIVDDESFFHAPEGKCRVYEIWSLDGFERLRCHDPLTGEYYAVPVNQEPAIKRKNRGRKADERIVYKWEVAQHWRCHFVSPAGDLLYQSEAPLGVNVHPYVTKFYPLTDGEVHSFVEDVIDQQRYVNRLITLIDHVMAASAKGVLLFPEDQKPSGQSWEDVVNSWATYNGVIAYQPQRGMPVPQQVVTKGNDVGAYDLLALEMRLFEDVSGVTDALQGKEAQAGVSATLYRQQTQNAVVALADLFETFNNFRTARDNKAVKLISI
ncbi:MAG: hypothetical protein J6Y87_00120 [Muribaculaceae bacterium]|nr:hypothetical protein [Muribaculaceae bacterium]